MFVHYHYLLNYHTLQSQLQMYCWHARLLPVLINSIVHELYCITNKANKSGKPAVCKWIHQAAAQAKVKYKGNVDLHSTYY